MAGTREMTVEHTHTTVPQGRARHRGTMQLPRWTAAVAGGLVTAVVVAGCGKEATSASTSTVLPGVTDVRSAAPAPVAFSGWPLTGVASDDVTERPSLAVKIENSPESRPQTGLEKTDMVFEEVVEGGITRFIAIFHSQVPSEIGPIRSVRPMDANVVAPLGGLLVYSGGQSAFLGLAPKAGLQVISMDAGGAGFYRSSARSAPHNVYGTPKTFWSQATKKHKAAPEQQFSYSTDGAGSTASTTGKTASKVSVAMSQSNTPRWTWNEKSSTYLRSEGSTPSKSADGVRLAATNVVVLTVDVVNTKYKDPAGNPVPETEIIGKGKALIASGGKAVEATWEKKKQSSPISLTVDGQAVKLAPGNTWVELMPSTWKWTVG